MMLRRYLAASCALAALLAFAPARAQQNTVTPIPAAPLTMTQFATFWGNAMASVGGNYSGTTPPAVFNGGAVPYQFWVDKSTTPRTLRIDDAAGVWVPIGTLDDTGHTFAFLQSITPNAQTGTSYPVVDGDRGKLITYSNAAPVAVALPQAGTGGIFLSGHYHFAQNIGTGAVTYTPAGGSLIGGNATLLLLSGQSALIVSDGTNYSVHGLTPATTGAVTHQWLTSLNAAGLFGIAQPSYADLSDTLTSNAFLTGAGALATPHAVAITGLVKGNGASAPVAYAGASCVNQFPRALDLNGAVTCAPVANTDLVNSTITLNAGANVGLTAPGAMVLGSIYAIGATSDTPRFAGLGLGGAATGANMLTIFGATSGHIDFKVPGVAGSNAITFPAGTTDFSATGGAHFFVRQNAAGGALDVVQPAAADLSNGTTGSGAVVLATGPTIAGALHTGVTDIQQALKTSGTITPTALAADVNDYNPTGLAAATSIRQDGGAADRNITGLTAQAGATEVSVFNIGATNKLILKTQSVSSTAANRFALGADIQLSPGQSATLWYDSAVSRWIAKSTYTAAGGTPAGTVTSVTCGTGLSGGTFTASGTCAVSLTTATNSLGADVTMNNTSNFFDGPSMAQGTSGTWFASGTVTIIAGTSAANLTCKLWDGTTVIAATRELSPGVGNLMSMSLSGILAAPAANIRISCNDATNTNTAMVFNSSGTSKDSTISGFRIN